MFLNDSASVAIRIGNTTISHRELFLTAQQISIDCAIEPNTRVALFSENRVEWFYAFYAGWLGGAAVVPIDHLATVKDIAYIVNDCTPSVVFVSNALLPILNKAIAHSHFAPKVIVIDDFKTVNKPSSYSITAFDPAQSATALLIYTSGTTGSPKGVMLSFENIKTNIEAVTSEVPILNGNDCTLVLLPLHHIFPLLGCVIVPIYLGGSVVLSPTLNPTDIIDTINRYGVTIIIGVPRLFAAFRKGILDKIEANLVAHILFWLASNIKSYAISKTIFKKVHQAFGPNLRFMISGGAALDIQVSEDFRSLGYKVLEGYGMTEAAPLITFSRPDAIKPGSVGKPPKAITLDIIDDEIRVKGANVMQGYYGKPHETAEVLKEGWLYTGDLGYLDKSGDLYITGRKKEIIVLSNGKNINPAIVEQELEHKYPIIKEIGLYLEDDKLKAVIVPNLLFSTDKGIVEIEEYIKHEVIEKYNNDCAPYKKIFHFELQNDELPRTRLGKLQRFKLQHLHLHKVEDMVGEEDEFEEMTIIKEFIFKEKSITPRGKDHLELDLGLDSLNKVSLQAFIESTFGLALEIQTILGFGKVMNLSKYIAENRKKMEVEEVNWSNILSSNQLMKLPKTWLSIHLIIASIKGIFKFYFKLSGKGNEKIPMQPSIIVANHQSFFDGMILASYLSCKQVRKTLYYAKEKHLSHNWQKYIAKKHNIIIVDKNKDLVESIRMMAEGLKQGRHIVIFPEGTRTKSGHLGSFKKMYAILAKELNAPIVPAVIKGAYQALPKGSAVPKWNQKITIEFLDAVTPTLHESYDDLNHKVREIIRSHLTTSAHQD